MEWPVDFYVDVTGSAPVLAFLDVLRASQRAKLLALIQQLKKHGPTLPFPYSSQVQGKLRELRTQLGKTNLRILYFGNGNRVFILLHGVVKDTPKLEKTDIEKAIGRMIDHESRPGNKARKREK
jgi:hypothetical protein